MPNSKISRTTPETQENSLWRHPAGTLGDLVRDAWIRAEKLGEVAGITSGGAARSGVPSFARALKRDDVAVVAEVKRSSPSKGPINPSIDAAALARAYADGGAAAVSVLTEPTRFGGSNEDLMSVTGSVRIPALKKDFHIAESQLVEAARLGASAALVIVRAVDPRRLRDLARLADGLDLEILFEVRDENELAAALDAGASLIGVNNRNLETLEIDRTTVERVVPGIPRDCIAIAESGYGSREDIERAAAAGADAVLIGSWLSASGDPEEMVRRLTGVPRRQRGGRR